VGLRRGRLQDAVGQLDNYLSITRLPMTAQASFDTVGRDPLHRDALRSVTVASPLDSTGIERRAVFSEAVRETAGRVRRVTGLLKMQPSRTDRIEEDRRWTLLRSFEDLDRSLGRIRDDLEAIAEAGPTDTPGNRVVWADEQSAPQRNKRFYAFGVTSSPIEIGREPNYRQFLDSFAQIFFVSATLRVSGEWIYICERLGLDADEVGTHDLPTPFDVARQAKLVCLTDFPSWAEQESVALESVAQQVHGFLREVSRDGDNGVMVLTTSRRAAAGVGDRLLRMRAALEEPYAVASAPLSGNARAVEYFKSQGGVVVGTKGLWQGVDISDPQRLRMVWINKIPFAPFGDPVTTARRELIRQRAEEAGDPDPDGTAIQRFYLPMAAMDLRQGVGRLIRSRNHRGVVVISDRKLGQPGRLNAIYRRVFLGSMDPGLVTDANGTFAGGNLYSMRDGWRAIWEFFSDLLPAERLAELTTDAALDEHTLLPSVLKIRRAELTPQEIHAGGPAVVLERTRDVGRLLIDNPEVDLHEYQREAIGAIAEGRDVLVNLPTSWGKSFIFQLPALALPGVTIVISPLVSLMTDQALALNR
jgi:ATP-dependent DNA helicase RecQ